MGLVGVGEGQALLQPANFILGPDATFNTENLKNVTKAQLQLLTYKQKKKKKKLQQRNRLGTVRRFSFVF